MASRVACLTAIAVVAALAAPATGRAAEPPAPPYSNADYWTLADAIMRNLDAWWDPGRGAYVLRGSGLRAGPFHVLEARGAGSAIHAVRRDGTRVRLIAGGPRVPLAGVSALELGAGYRVVPMSAPRAATLAAVAVSRQPTDPHPGPSLQVELARRGGFHQRTLAVRLEP